MKFLGIDSSNKHLTVIACSGEKTEIFFDETCGVEHSVYLMDAVEKTAKKAGLNLCEADFFACVVGAGSFTGIRIGVSTVKALCYAYEKPFLSITSFDALAYNKTSGRILAAIDAKHNGYYVCGYNCEEVDFPPTFIDGEKLKELAETYVVVSAEVLPAISSERVSPAQGFLAAIEAKSDEICSDINKLMPLYLRKSQAEEGRL